MKNNGVQKETEMRAATLIANSGSFELRHKSHIPVVDTPLKKNINHANTHPTNTGTPATLIGIDRDSVHQISHNFLQSVVSQNKDSISLGCSALFGVC